MESENKDEGGAIVGINLKITPVIAETMIQQTKYVANLSIWKQYMIWRYTLGSGQLNMLLIGIPDETRLRYWVRQFFELYNIQRYGLNAIEMPFNQWSSHFTNPGLVQNDNIDTCKKIVANFAWILSRIIINAPIAQHEDFLLYKASSVYNSEMKRLLTEPLKANEVVRVPQLLFNSTSYDPEFEFNTFVADSGDSVLWMLTRRTNIPCLFINPIFHAYPHEREFLLPPGCIFNIRDVRDVQLEYVNKSDFKLEVVQEAPYVIGEVYRYLGQPSTGVKPMKLFVADIEYSKQISEEIKKLI